MKTWTSVDLSGQRFGRLTVVHEVASIGHGRRWQCRCDCGVCVDVDAGNLKRAERLSRSNMSCGCWRSEHQKQAARRHGDAIGNGTPEYRAWVSMLQRCHNPASRGFNNYGGRGINVSTAWRENFGAFLQHIGRRPSPLHSLDRIDNEGHYEPGNVRWATKGEQRHNQRPLALTAKDAEEIRRLYAAGGVTHRALAKRFNVAHRTIWGAIHGLHHYAERGIPCLPSLNSQRV
jgi:hypothetical protein